MDRLAPVEANNVRYDAGELFQDLCEPYRNDLALNAAQANDTLIDSKLAACATPPANAIYIDSNGDGRYNATGDGVYNGVLNVDPATGKTVANSRTPTVHVRSSLIQLMSTSDAVITALTSAPALSVCTDGIAFVNTPVTFKVAVRDANPTIYAENKAGVAPLGLAFDLPGNLLPAGTKIAFSTSNGKIISGGETFVVPNSIETSAAAWIHTLVLTSDATQTKATEANPLSCSNPDKIGALTVTATTPLGVVTKASYTVSD